MKRAMALAALALLAVPGQSQEVYHHIGNEQLYLFLDELANLHVIELNTGIKPYSRQLIAEKLQEASEKSSELTVRQQKEVAFYLKDFNKELKPDKNFDKRLDVFYYKDSLFTLSVNPILGMHYFSNDNDLVYHRFNGGEAFGYLGKNIGFYASLRDNHENERLSEFFYRNNRRGAVYKNSNDYSEMRGGISYAWKWGSVAVVKDNFSWGNNYNGANIFSGRTPSFAQIKLRVKPVKWI
ncbi:MAG: hypothetical protein AAGB22_04700, partial [Bacteroidota bacterium]